MSAGARVRAVDGGNIPAATCPVTRQSVILPAYLWTLKAPVRMNCPACGRVHVWQPLVRRLGEVLDADEH